MSSPCISPASRCRRLIRNSTHRRTDPHDPALHQQYHGAVRWRCARHQSNHSRHIDMLLEAGMNIKVVLLPDGGDPDSYANISLPNISKVRRQISSASRRSCQRTEAATIPYAKLRWSATSSAPSPSFPTTSPRSVYVHDRFEIEEQVLLNEGAASGWIIGTASQAAHPPNVARQHTGSFRADQLNRAAGRTVRNEEQVVEQQFEHTVPFSSPTNSPSGCWCITS